MHTSKLYLPQSGLGGADIVLALPSEGSGALQFAISRAGQSNQILGPMGWQSADYWFETESGQMVERKATVHLPEQILNHLSYSNYRVIARWANSPVTEQTYLQGGDLVANPLLGLASQVVAKPSTTSDHIGRIVPDSVDTDVINTSSFTQVPASSTNTTSIDTSRAPFTLQMEHSKSNPTVEPSESITNSSTSNSPKVWIILGAMLLLVGLAWFAFSSQNHSVSPPVNTPQLGATEPTVPAIKSSQAAGTNIQTQNDSSLTKGPGVLPVDKIGKNVQPDVSNSANIDQSHSKPSATGRSDPATSGKGQTKPVQVGAISPPAQSRSDSHTKESSDAASKGSSSVPPTPSPPDLNRLVLDAMKK